MKVTAVCYGAMRDFVPSDGNEVAVELGPEATIGDLVDTLGAPRKLASSILVGGRPGRIDEKLEDGVRVTLMPPFSGGEEEEPSYG
jgi:molybdopterin converting factor small subunit